MIHLLRAAGASLVLDARGAGAPVLVHWGRDLGPLDQDDLRALADAVIPAVTPSSIDRPLRIGVVPTLADGWSGRPGLDAHPAPGPVRHVTTTDAGTDAAGGGVVDTVVVAGAHEVRLRFALSPQGVLEVDQRVRNVSDAPTVLRAASVVLPVPDRAREVLDFAGRWAGERAPQRLTPGFGTWLSEI